MVSGEPIEAAIRNSRCSPPDRAPICTGIVEKSIHCPCAVGCIHGHSGCGEPTVECGDHQLGRRLQREVACRPGAEPFVCAWLRGGHRSRSDRVAEP